jgi:hypothetical protein
MSDRFDELWRLQEGHQIVLGLDPADLPEPTRRALSTELLALLHEEVTDMGRSVPTYKRHLLRLTDANPMDKAEHVADVLKTAIAWAQLNGLSDEQVVEAFRRKTAALISNVEGERVNLERGTPVLCVDLDDVVCDITDWRGGLVKSRRGTTPAELLESEERYKDFHYSSGAFVDCPPIPGAVEALKAVRVAGYKIIFITARPQWQYKRLHADTVSWMRRHRVPYDLVLFNKDKCEALYQHVRPAWPRAFVEDHVRNATALAAIGVRVYLYDTAFNREMPPHPNVTRVHSWSDVLTQLGIPQAR